MQTMFRLVRHRFLKWTERKLNIPVEPLVPVERIGSAYGGWIIPENSLKSDSICYLVGAGEDISFDLGVAEKYHCLVHIFDPTPRAVAHFEGLIENLKQGELTKCSTSATGFYPAYPASLTESLYFHAFGIWNENTILRFFAPKNESNVSHSLVNLQQSDRFIEVPVRRLSGIMQELGHIKIDLLKLDIEGAEYQVILSLLDDKIEVDILCIEFDESAANHLDTHYLDRIEGSLKALIAAGFHVVAKEKDCHNYTLIHQRRL
jgi:FkbM family methyltransferase